MNVECVALFVQRKPEDDIAETEDMKKPKTAELESTDEKETVCNGNGKAEASNGDVNAEVKTNGVETNGENVNGSGDHPSEVADVDKMDTKDTIEVCR